jgi:hypothetical protein
MVRRGRVGSRRPAAVAWCWRGIRGQEKLLAASVVGIVDCIGLSGFFSDQDQWRARIDVQYGLTSRGTSSGGSDDPFRTKLTLSLVQRSRPSSHSEQKCMIETYRLGYYYGKSGVTHWCNGESGMRRYLSKFVAW